ncbi:MAG: AAA family ATPase [Lachnospirales bacterium]
MNKTDKKRASYYKFYTGNLWKDMNNYDLVINTGKVGIDNAVATIIDYVRKYDYVK